MKLLSRTSGLVLIAVLPLVWPSFGRAVDVWTVGVNNTRQGWNKFETVLTPTTVPNLRKIRDFTVDDKMDVSPLVVGDKLYVFTMKNTAYVFDVNTGAQLGIRKLAAPFDPIVDRPGVADQMDRHGLYHNWGITATPVIDVATNTIYVTTFGKPNATSPNTERNNMLWVLDADTLADKQPAVLIQGNADNGGGGIANGFTTPYQKMRAGLGLLTDAGGNKAVVVSFSMNGENPEGPGHGFVVAYDVRGLNREPGFTPTPAIWNVTPGGGAGGVWMSGSGPAIDGDDVYLVTGNGMDPGRKPGNFAESFVKLDYTAGVSGVNNGKPQLAVIDYWGAFSDFDRLNTDEGRDQDLGAAGVFLIPERGNLIGGGKDGILYNLNKNNLGKNTWNFHFNLPFVASYLPNPPNGPAGLPPTTVPNQNWPIVNRDRNLPAQTSDGKTHHIHGTPVYMELATHGIFMSGVRMSASRRTTSTSLPNAFSRSAPKGRSSPRATCPRPAACLVGASSSPRMARFRTPPLSGACTRRRGMRTPRSSTGLSSRTTRRRFSMGARWSYCFTATRTTPTIWGRLPSTLRRWWPTGKSTSARSVTRSSSTASEDFRSASLWACVRVMQVRHERGRGGCDDIVCSEGN